MEEDMRILVIEDNSDIAANLGDFLEERGHTVDFAADGVTGLHLAVVNDFDAIVLDLNLPGMDGLEVCRKLRQDARKQTPVLMLTARDALESKLDGFEAGADDYLVKPFALQEVDARLAVLLRRGKGPQSRILNVADLEYNLDTLEVRRGQAAATQSDRAEDPAVVDGILAVGGHPAGTRNPRLGRGVARLRQPARAYPRAACGGGQTVPEATDPDAPRHRLPDRRSRCCTDVGSAVGSSCRTCCWASALRY